MLRVALRPQNPSIDAHHRVIEINAGFANQMPVETEVDIDDGIDKSYGVNEDVLCATKPNTCHSRHHGYIFQPGGFFHAHHKGAPYLVKCVQRFTNISAVELGLRSVHAAIFRVHNFLMRGFRKST